MAKPGITRTKRRRLAPTYWLLLIPPLAIFIIFSWWPIARGLIIAFQSTNLIKTEWVGLENFEAVLADPLLGTAIGNTMLFTVLAAAFGFPIPILLATIVSEMRRTKKISSALAFLPVVIPTVVTVLLWQMLLNPANTGVLNTLLGAVGVPAQPWLQSSGSAMISVVLTVTWASFGSATVIYLSTLSSIDHQLYEAAELDGASIRRRFWHVTLPQLRGTILILLLLQIIGSFQIFTEPFLLTGGGPNNATLTLLMLIYRYAFLYGDFGQATALSLMLAVFLGVISAIYLLITRRAGRS